MSMFRSRLLRLALAGAITSLAACGGGDSSSTPAAPTSSATGTLSDSPVGGVSYSTSGGVTGTTDSQGRFKYNPGETVTFRIGSLILGSVIPTGADATITPLQIAASVSGLSDTERQNMVTNLLVLLQSLDSDGNPQNGISIPGTAATALTSTVATTIDLKVAPTTFKDSSTLSSLASTAGGTVVDPIVALEHFRTQFLKDLAGVYTADLGNNQIIAFRFNADGSYLMAQVTQQDLAGQPGIERGRIEWDPATGEVLLVATAANVTLDTNGEWGLSHPLTDEKVYFSLDGGTLVVKTDYVDPAQADEELRLARLNPGSGLVGPWALNKGDVPASSLATSQFLFLADGRYLMIDPVGDDEYSEPDDPKCGWEGLEFGHYTFSGGVLTALSYIADTNDCAGLYDKNTGEYSAFSGVTIGGSAVSAGGKVLLVAPETLAAVYAGQGEVMSTTTGEPVHLDGSDMYCTPPGTVGEVEPVTVSIAFDAAAGSFMMKFTDEGEPVTVSGSFHADTGAMAWQEILPPEVVLVSDTTRYYSEGSIVYTATYDAATDTVSGTSVDSVSTSWDLSSDKVTCTATSKFTLARATTTP